MIWRCRARGVGSSTRILRSKQLAIVGAILAGAIIAGCSTESPADTKISVDIFGDSITYQSRAHLQLDEYDVYLQAVPGITLELQLPGIAQSITRSPDVLVIALGANNLRNWGPGNAADVIEVLDAAAGVGCVRWVNLAAPSPNVAVVNELLVEQAASRDNFAVIDWAHATSENPTWMSVDGVHPSTPEGEIGFAELLANAVRHCPEGVSP